MKRALACFDVKPKSRNAEQLFRAYAELHLNETMGKGGEGIKRFYGKALRMDAGIFGQNL